MAFKGNGFMVSKESYTDFEIRAEFWVDSKANSGVFIRCTYPTKVTATNAYEVNIYDERPDPSYGAEDNKHPSGRIALQYATGFVKFRRVQIKAL
jgi:hypothetical protein